MEKHSLLFGVKAGEKVHFDFQVRMPVVRDTLEALRLTHDKYGTTEGAEAVTFYRIAVVAQALTSLGDLTDEEITVELLLDGLSDDDFDLIDAQIEAIKKKRLISNSKSLDSELSSSRSADMESASSKSAE